MKALEQVFGLVIGIVVTTWLMRQIYPVLDFCPVP